MSASILPEAEKIGEQFFAELGVKTLAEARKLDAFFIRDKMEKSKLRFGVVTDGHFIVGQSNDLFMKKIVALIPTEYYGAIEKAADTLVKGMGQLYLTGFVQHLSSSLKGTVNAWKGMDDETKADVKESFRGVGGVVPSALRETLPASPAAPRTAPAEE